MQELLAPPAVAEDDTEVNTQAADADTDSESESGSSVSDEAAEE